MAIRTEYSKAKNILNEQFGGAAFVKQLPLLDRYLVLARIAAESGRKKAAFKMSIYASVKIYTDNNAAPYSFLRNYGIGVNESRLARALAISIHEKLGNSDKANKLKITEIPEKELNDLADSCKFALRFIERMAHEEKNEAGREAFLHKMRYKENKGPEEEKIISNITRAHFSNAPFCADVVILPLERKN